MNARPEPRLAKNYQLVYDIVKEQGRGTHLAMADVHALSSSRQPGIGFTTVYRALARLRELGLIAEILLPGADSAYYEPAGDAHAHFRCDACGNVQDINYQISERVIGDLAASHGLEVSEVLVSLHGRCINCAAARSIAPGA
ncbi:MAG: transcriptional repressor [Candidatus Eremiobacteraeota bacterium]|nr:transcriptional repressor [Candidatus Eremiobacteraeota bacterium]